MNLKRVYLYDPAEEPDQPKNAPGTGCHKRFLAALRKAGMRPRWRAEGDLKTEGDYRVSGGGMVALVPANFNHPEAATEE